MTYRTRHVAGQLRLATVIPQAAGNNVLPERFFLAVTAAFNLQGKDMSHVLIIDDSEEIRSSVRAMMESMGFDVSEATDGQDGVDRFRQERFDLVISDVVMPRKDGLQAIREIREMSPDIPIVAMSGGTHVSAGGCDQITGYTLSIAEELGATRTIGKPFSRENLRAVIRESVAEAGTQFFRDMAR
jgi:CheY-like chemotaxis protein